MADWDDDEFEPGIKKEQPEGLWDDEDAEDDDIRESWEDEDDDATKALKKEPVSDIKKEPKLAKVDSGKRGKAVDARTTKTADDVLSDPVAEKLRQQRLIEEADYKSTTELFAKRDNEKSLDNFIPKSEHDFMEYAGLISQKLRHHEKSYHYIALLKSVMRLSMASLKAADAKEIASSVTAIANEKLKMEKEANAGKKKQGAKKKQLHVEKLDDDVVSATYHDDADDYEFM
ncbi:hypothetical protein KSP39_PZI018752 [Platanthera zijinensis]|uniref:Eukaryotic translation initiation factor 3 subunit J n=1 Tax=Platanthera zijinensis TaxID=2320716 RepID=A0AAP0B4C0_9ASPA